MFSPGALPPGHTRVGCAGLRLCVLTCLLTFSCAPLEQPPFRETIEVRGSAYDRGLSHGTQLKSKIHSFYTTLLTNSLFPYLSREQPDIASLLHEYDDPKYQDGRFAYELMLESGKSVERSVGPSVRQELQGISDGSGLSYDEVLVLNTFVDTVLAVRGVALSIRLARAPSVKSVAFLGADGDGVDNDGDGQLDEPGEGVLDPYVPALFGSMVELNPASPIAIVLTDADGVDPQTVRLLIDGQLFTSHSPELALEALSPTDLSVRWTPSSPLPAARTTTLVIQAGDTVILDNPPPSHASFMRDEELAFTTRGAGLRPRDVRRVRLSDGRTRPPPVALGVRGAMTREGNTLLAQHFALLDANTAHKHTVAIRHVPDDGPAFVTVGWAGIAYGFAGVNEKGVGYACNPSDTLDNSVVGSVLDDALDISQAKLVARGTPMGFIGRKLLEQADTAAGARDLIAATPRVYGWTCLTGDRAGGLEAIELDSNVFGDASGGNFPISPTELDAEGARYAGDTDDELVLASNYVKNVPDIATLTVAGQRIVPQRSWSGFFFRSRRAADGLRTRLEAAQGQVDVPFLQGLMADPEFVDQSDSMNAVVLDLTALEVHAAMGAEPATYAPFESTAVRP